MQEFVIQLNVSCRNKNLCSSMQHKQQWIISPTECFCHFYDSTIPGIGIFTQHYAQNLSTFCKFDMLCTSDHIPHSFLFLYRIKNDSVFACIPMLYSYRKITIRPICESKLCTKKLLIIKFDSLLNIVLLIGINSAYNCKCTMYMYYIISKSRVHNLQNLCR